MGLIVLTLIFDKDIQHVLMCYHSKQNAYNYIGGKIEYMEDRMDAAYRELLEETGIRREDVDLHFVREEHVTCVARCYSNKCWKLYISAGILKNNVVLKEEKNRLEWVAIDDMDKILKQSFGNGNCVTYLLESLDVLQVR